MQQESQFRHPYCHRRTLNIDTRRSKVALVLSGYSIYDF